MKNYEKFISSKKQGSRGLLFQASGLGAIFAVSILALSLAITLFGAFSGNTAKAESIEPASVGMSTVASDLSVNIADSPDPLPPGSNIRYSITLTNSGPDFANNLVLSTAVPANTTFVSVTQTSKFTFTCTTPAVGGTGAVTCRTPSFINGSVLIVLTVNVNSNTPSGTIITGSASISSSDVDPNAGNNTATTTTTVLGTPTPTITPTPSPTVSPTATITPTPTPTVTPTPITPTPTPTPISDLAVTVSDSPDPVAVGSNIRYSIILNNNGPNYGVNTVLATAVPANTTFVSLSPATKFGFTCTTPAVGGTGNITCTNPSFIIGSILLTLTVNVNSNTVSGTVISDTVSVSSVTIDPVPGNNSATATTAITGGTAPPNLCPVNTLDFTGDKRADYVVFRPSNNTWYVNPSSAANNLTFSGQPFGNAATDILTPGDYDGDGRTDYAVWRRTTGTFYVMLSSNNTLVSRQFGQNGDEPVARDYDGDCKTDFAVTRQVGGTLVWYILNSGTNNSFRSEQFGANTDIVAPGDYDGDGRYDLAVFRGTGDQAATFYVRQSSNGVLLSRQFGIGSDLVVPGDYDGDRKTDFAVVRTGSAYQWYILRSSDGAQMTRQLGSTSDLPTQNDYDGDGRTDISVYHPQNATFYVIRSTDGGLATRTFGQNGDFPVATFDTH